MVIIIIGIPAAIAIPTFLAQRTRGWEAAAQSDVRNAAAAAAATSCAADKNPSSYDACKTADQLKPYGYNKSEGVTINGMLGDADEWSTSMQHTSGGSAYTFITSGADAGKVKENTTRGAAAPTLTP